MADVIKNRYDFVILFDVENGNPNGDPDAGNMPRIDQETGHGIVTDVCLKRKIRNYVDIAWEYDDYHRIYIKERIPLNRSDLMVSELVGHKDELTQIQIKEKKEAKTIGVKLKKDDPDIDRKICEYMCRHFFDIRTFGAVMTTFVKGALNCGQVRGPVQIGFARSIDPIIPQEIGITRIAITTEKDAENKETEMGKKYIIPYALYKAEGYVSANLARKVTGFSEDDLQLLWTSIINMFENDHSAARGNMAVRELIVFKHDKELGNAPAYKVFDTVDVKRKNELAPARAYSDYTVTVHTEQLPDGVVCTRMV